MTVKNIPQREPVISPSKPINGPLKTDWYNGTAYNRLF
jgi:hypothetical protein